MHGLGNDFIIIDAINQTIQPTAEQISDWANRRTGVGFDQCLLIEKSPYSGIDFFYRIFNADGSEVGQCGNGARCLARFIHYYGLSKKSFISVATATTRMQLQLNSDDTVTVDLGRPKFAVGDIPMQAHQQHEVYYLTDSHNHRHAFHTVNVGNPHAVVRVNNLAQTPVKEIGKFIGEHAMFPEQANVGFMEIVNQSIIKLRVFERGCGETQACGSGAVAAAVVGRKFHQLNSDITVELLGGSLKVHWPDPEKSVMLTGPAVFVYEGILSFTD